MVVSCGEDKCKHDVTILHIRCLVESLQVKQQPRKHYYFLQSQRGEYQSLRETIPAQTLCQPLPSQGSVSY